jgi:hypothetical protein
MRKLLDLLVLLFAICVTLVIDVAMAQEQQKPSWILENVTVSTAARIKGTFTDYSPEGDTIILLLSTTFKTTKPAETFDVSTILLESTTPSKGRQLAVARLPLIAFSGSCGEIANNTFLFPGNIAGDSGEMKITTKDQKTYGMSKANNITTMTMESDLMCLRLVFLITKQTKGGSFKLNFAGRQIAVPPLP